MKFARISEKPGIPRRIFTLLPYRRRRTPIDAANTPRSCHPQRERCFRRISEKLKAAQELGIRIFVIKRPPLHPNFLSVNGKYGLRRTVEQYYPGFYPLPQRTHYGNMRSSRSCGCDMDIFNIQGTPRPPEFAVILPNGD